MNELFKKGQLVPKRIGHIKCHKRVRHQIVFGADVSVSGNVFHVLPNTGPYLFQLRSLKRKRNNGTFQDTSITIEGIKASFKEVDDATARQKFLGVAVHKVTLSRQTNYVKGQE